MSQASLLVQGGGESRDVYDCFLTQAEIQGNINHVNGEGSGLGVSESLHRAVWGWLSLGPALMSQEKIPSQEGACALLYGRPCLERRPHRGCFCLDGDPWGGQRQGQAFQLLGQGQPDWGPS